MKEIELKQTRSNIKLTALVDDDDYEELNKYKWHVNYKGYAKKGRRGESPASTMHAMIVSVPIGMECDHINGDRRDNRRANLRVCTSNENMMNKKVYKNNKTGYKGVNFQGGKFHASICLLGNKIHLGCFKTVEDAAKKYDEKAKELFGVFARLNFRD